MKNPSEIGGARAPGRHGEKVTETEVRRRPMWVPWDDPGDGTEGKWRLIPSDYSHQSRLINNTDPVNRLDEEYYAGKGFVPESRAPRESLPKLVAMAVRARAERARVGMPAPG